MTIYELAGQAYEQFETAERQGGETFVRLKEGADEWLQDLVRDAHGDLLPDDWRYATIQNALGWIHDNEPADLDDALEFADQEADVYNDALFSWLSSHLSRQYYVDDAVNEFGWDEERGISHAIAMGQVKEAEEVYASVVQCLRDHLDEGVE